MKFFLHIVFFSALIFSTAWDVKVASAEQAVGILKLESIPVKLPWDPKDPSWARNPAGATFGSIFYIQVDDLEPIKISAKESGLVEDLNLDIKHIIKISFNGKRIESFWFDFKKYECNELRLWYKPMYATWSLWPNGPNCKLE